MSPRTTSAVRWIRHSQVHLFIENGTCLKLILDLEIAERNVLDDANFLLHRLQHFYFLVQSQPPQRRSRRKSCRRSSPPSLLFIPFHRFLIPPLFFISVVNSSARLIPTFLLFSAFKSSMFSVFISLRINATTLHAALFSSL